MCVCLYHLCALHFSFSIMLPGGHSFTSLREMVLLFFPLNSRDKYPSSLLQSFSFQTNHSKVFSFTRYLPSVDTALIKNTGEKVPPTHRDKSEQLQL